MKKGEWLKKLRLPADLEVGSTGMKYRWRWDTAPSLQGPEDRYRQIALGNYTHRYLAECQRLLASLDVQSLISKWRGIQRDWRHSSAFTKRVRDHKAQEMARASGLLLDEHGSPTYGKGDYYSIQVLDTEWRPAHLRRLHSCGRLLAVVAHTRKRVYARKWYPSVRSDHYLVGENESGTIFHHAVPSHVRTIQAAISWIWHGAKIDGRQGDVAITPARHTIPSGTLVSDHVIMDRHVVTGEIHRNGTLYVRRAVLHHTAGQHPDVIVGDQWHQVLIARRSTAANSSSD